jgi:hypothetical protein
MSRSPPPLQEPVPSFGEFEGIINAKRKKDFGLGALVSGINVEVTDTKKLVRRDGYVRLDSTPDLRSVAGYTGLYGSINQRQLLAVHDGALVLIDPNNQPSFLSGGIIGRQFSWDEDPANNVYYTSEAGDNGIVLASNSWRWLLSFR